MQRHSSPTRQRSFLSAAAAIGCLAAIGAAPPAAAEGEVPPARLIGVSGAWTQELTALTYAQPVLVAYAKEGWTAVVFSEDPGALDTAVESLIVDEVADCPAEGAVSCCSTATMTFVLNTDQGWVDLGEQCETPSLEPGNTDQDPYEPPVELVEISAALSQELFDCCGIVDDYIDFAKADGGARVLINSPSSTKAEFPAPPLAGCLAIIPAAYSVATDATLPSLPLILAHDHPPPVSGCVTSVDYCKKNNGRKCHAQREHWYVKVETPVGDLWCQRAGCNCP